MSGEVAWLWNAGAAGGLSVATGAKGGAGDDALPETPAVAATATENERVNLNLSVGTASILFNRESSQEPARLCMLTLRHTSMCKSW